MRHFVAAVLLLAAPLSQAASLGSTYGYLSGDADVQDQGESFGFERLAPGPSNDTGSVYTQLGDSTASATGNFAASLGPVVGNGFTFSSTGLLLVTAQGGEYTASSSVLNGFDFDFSLDRASTFSLQGASFLNLPQDPASSGLFDWSLTGPSGQLLGSSTAGTGALQIFASSLLLAPGSYTFGLFARADASQGLGTSSQTVAYNLTGSVTPVPLPAAAWLLLSGLGAVGTFARRRRALAT